MGLAAGRIEEISEPREVSWPIWPLVTVFVGILGGLVWFWRAYQIPENWGLDASNYLSISNLEVERAFRYVHLRSFGYPFYLAIFRYLFPAPNAFVLPALLFQLVLHFATSLFLVFALRRAGATVPWIVVALLLAHPALSGVSGISLSDGITSSFITAAFGMGILLFSRDRFLAAKALGFSLFMGLALCVRPQLLPFECVVFPFAAVVVGILGYQKKRRIRDLFANIFVFSIASAAVAAPLVYHLLDNCYQVYHRTCVIEPGRANFAMRESLSARATRVWLAPHEARNGAEVCYNQNRAVFAGCRFTEEAPLTDMLSCYRANIMQLPVVLGERAIGLFDHRHIHPYAIRETTALESWVIRVFSMVGLLGVVATVGLWCLHIARGTGTRHAYLLFPLVFLFSQVHFHPEHRYLFPAIAMFFTSGVSALLTRPFHKQWQVVLFFTVCVALSWLYVTKVVAWDATVKPSCATGETPLHA
jgi:hypothetical protein